MRIHRLLSAFLACFVTGAFAVDLTIPMGGMQNLGTTSLAVNNVSCAGTLEMTLGTMVDATGSVNLSGCMLQLDVPMGAMVPTDIPIITMSMTMMMPMGMFMGLPEGTPVMVGGMTRYMTYMGGGFGNDVMLVSMMPMMPMPMPMPMMPAAGTNVKDMWWSPEENGWGMSIVTHGDTTFATLFIYDANGKPTWLVLPAGTWDMTHTLFTGAVYAPTGTPFYSYDPSRLKVGNAAGSLTLMFQDYDNAVLNYDIGGVTGMKLITREIFATGPGMQTDASDLWWGGMGQNGWGLTIRQQASTLFSVWYTYDANGQPTWYTMPGGTWTDASTYQGRLYRTTSSPWVGHDYFAGQLQVFDAGPVSINFSASGASMNFTADGHTGSIPLTREPF